MEAPMALLLWTLTLALADIPPPPGYVETCTVEQQCRPGEEGTVCRAWFGEPEACAPLVTQGWIFRCRTPGASAWSEIYCRGAKSEAEAPRAEAAAAEPDVAAPDEAAPPAPSGLCGGLGAGAAGLLLALGWARRGAAPPDAADAADEAPRRAA